MLLSERTVLVFHIMDTNTNMRQYILTTIQYLPQNDNHKRTLKRRVLQIVLVDVIFIGCLSNLSLTNERQIIKFDEIKEM